MAEAHSRQDAAALAELAAQPQPDPWFVADELLRTGHAEAAAAYAQAVSGKAVEQLPAFVAAQAARPADPQARAALAAAAAAIGQGQPAEALRLLEAPAPARGSVVAVGIATVRGGALSRLRR